MVAGPPEENIDHVAVPPAVRDRLDFRLQEAFA